MVFNKRVNLRILEKGELTEGLIESMVKDRVDLVKKLGLDAMTLSPGRPERFQPYARLSETEWRRGCESIRYLPSTDETVTVDHGFGERGVDRLRERIGEVREEAAVDPAEFYAFERAVKAFRAEGLEVFIFAGCTVFDWHGSWHEQALRWLHLHPGLMHQYLEAFNRRAIEHVKVGIDLGAEGVMSGGDLAYRHGPLFPPRVYRELILPYQRMQTDAFHRRGAFVVNRSDGNIWPIAEDFLRNSGVDGYCEIDKRAGMQLGRLKERYGDAVCLIGNVDCGGALVYGSAEDVAKETRECIREGSPGGGHILCSSNVIHAAVKPRNYLAMVEAGRRYGGYRP